MHSSYCKVVEVKVGEDNPAYKNSYHTTEIKILCCHVAQYTEEIGNDNLDNFAIHQKSEFTEHERADNS